MRSKDPTSTGDWDACLTRFSRPKLLIIDEFGNVLMPPQTDYLLYRLVAARYETGSMLRSSIQGGEEVVVRVSLCAPIR